jgi:acetyl-CoA carboxylase biotin carboxyl carrier protein
MDIRWLQRLARLMQQAELSDLEVEDKNEGVRVRLQRGSREAPAAAPVVHVTQAATPAPVSAPAAPVALASPEHAAAAPSGPPPGTQPFVSPMVGTFYRASSPEAEPFVAVGSTVKPDTVLCIIEAMKVMNEIKAECSGTVAEVLAENGEPVEFGQPLFLIKTA